MHSGNFVLILHTHLPWVLHHGTKVHGVDMVAEAVAECYIPLLNVFNDLLDEGIPPKVTLDISPVLCEQLEHPDFKKYCVKYFDTMIEGAIEDEKEFEKWGHDPHQVYLARFWRQWYSDRKRDYIEKYDKSIVRALKRLQDEGAIEVMTCGATHGYLPLLGLDRSVNLQIKAAVENYKKYFGRDPKGIWLPECAYRPSYEWHSLIPVAPFNIPHLRSGVEQFLANHGLNYFVTDQFHIERTWPIGQYVEGNKDNFVSVHSDNFYHKDGEFDKSPLKIYNIASSDKVEYGTAACFARHENISMQVWSGEVGYPGEPNYLDFHKKRLESMLRYWRITDVKIDMLYKQYYHPDWIWEKLDHQSNHFIHHIENTLNHYHNTTGKFGTLSAPFDTELFGHWWFEGPEFLRYVIKGLHHSPYVNMATASEQLYKVKPEEVVGLPEGSWGANRNHDVWSNGQVTWTWEYLYNDERRMRAIYEKYPPKDQTPKMRRIMTQALRELLLQQASDWQFLITTAGAKEYSIQRLHNHHSDFNLLCDLVEEYANKKKLSKAQDQHLKELEERNSVFPELKLEWWQPLYGEPDYVKDAALEYENSERKY